MGLFSKWFKRDTAGKKAPDTGFESPECQKLWDLGRYMKAMLEETRYIAKKDFQDHLLEEKKIIEYFDVLQRSGLLDTFCRKNGMGTAVAEEILEQYEKFGELVDQHNENYIQQAMIREKDYLDHILADVDPAIDLDEDQRRVILTEEDYCLVIAGAGAGKTTTVAAKVKYLVEKKQIDPSQILVVSFTNKAVEELRDKVNRDLNIACPIATFHSTGNAILRKQNPEPLNIVDSSKLYYVLQDYFRTSVLKNEGLAYNTYPMHNIN